MSENGAYRQDILEFAEKTYGTKPEYLWQKTPDTGVLRHSGNKKLKRMRELGVYSVRGVRGVPRALSAEIAKLARV